MPLNSALEQKYLAEIEGLTVVLQDFVTRWQGASSEEERVVIEADGIALFERLLDFDFKLQKLQAGSRHRLKDYDDAYGFYRYALEMNLAKLRKLTSLFIKYFNSQQIALNQLLGQLKRVRQKRAAIALWSSEESKFVLADHFLNYDHLDTSYTAVNACAIETSEGVLTLPIVTTEALPIKRASVGTGSNGVPGNSDVVVTTNNQNPEYAVNSDPNNWFEYERLDAGPLRLSFKLELNREEIVNQIYVTPINQGSAYAYTVEDILFTGSGTNSTSVHDLVSNKIDADAFTVKAAGNDNQWQITFLPVRAKTITIKFSQPNAHTVKVARANFQEGLRQRWAIGIKEVGVRRVEYDEIGGINSLPQAIPAGSYGALPFADVWPLGTSLYSLGLELSFDGGETWKASPINGEGIGSTVLMDGVETEVIWRLALSRDAAALKNSTGFSQDDNTIYPTESILRVLSKNQSPAIVNIPSVPVGARIYAYQPKVGRRGDRLGQIKLGEGTGTVLSIPIPFSPLDFDLEPDDVRVFVNRREYANQRDNAAIGANEWAFSDDYREIEFASGVGAGAEISMVLDEERMMFELRPDGYYHTPELPFDPDKQNITIRHLPRKPIEYTLLLPRDKKVVALPHKNIVNGSAVFSTLSGATWTEVTTRASLVATPTSYLVDYLNGILHLNAELDEEEARITYQHLDDTVLSDSAFDVIFDGPRPSAIRVLPEHFQAIEATDVINASPGSRFVMKDGSYSARTDHFSASGTSKTLTHDRIVKGTVRVSSNLLSGTADPEEVTFIDGKTEFLGLIPMDREDTAEATADGVGNVEFTLAAGQLWYSSLPVVFGDVSVFATLQGSVGAVTSPGDYYVAADGTVTVNVGVGNSLASGIRFKYFYRDPNFDPRNKFSVDYKRGGLYSFTTLNTAATVTYKAASYNCAYDVVIPLSGAVYSRSNNSVSVPTENLVDLNSLVKITWSLVDQNSTLSDFERYFSPVISVLGLRFS